VVWRFGGLALTPGHPSIASASTSSDQAARRVDGAAAYPVNKICNGCSGTWQFKTYRVHFETPAFAGEYTERSA
jgi:hypothetical protein